MTFYRVYVVCKGTCYTTFERMIPEGQTVEQARCHICNGRLVVAEWATRPTRPEEEAL